MLVETVLATPLEEFRRASPAERQRPPTLAISAKDDLYNTAGGAKYAAEQIPGARLILLPTGGHAWLGHDAVVRDEVVNFLRRATSSR
jgi:pimeloyl-ACP methyl ester carboxylesterase